jgi:hypothetical protein
MNTMIYGKEKSGKTTWASTINKGEGVLFCATEEGHKHLSVYKVAITSWEDFLLLGSELKKDPKGYKTLVIDIVDYLVVHCEHYVCKKMGVDHPSDLPFGKGFTAVKREFLRVITAINQMGFSFVFISHSKEREMKTKTASWTYMDTTLSATWSTLVCGMCDFIFYIYIDEDGNRKIRTKGHKYINSGDRTGKLPEVMALDFNEIQKILSK